jgi:sugar phosphate isomerase/epimerase
MKTRTGGFRIGFRRTRQAWQNDLPALAKWASDSGFELIDLLTYTPQDHALLAANHLHLGSVDLLDMGKLTQPDAGARADLIARNVDYIRQSAPAGAKLFFTIVPGEKDRSRADNYRLAVESFQPLAQAASEAGAKIVIEGYPGGPPHFSLLCCTPETCRSFIKEMPGSAVGLNYDPSHLVRLGVDPIRFLSEFLPHVYHVHGKDTQLFPDAVYEFGLFQEAAFAKPHAFGSYTWRYTIPGDGQTPWPNVLQILSTAGYRGAISLELEDENYWGGEEQEKEGLLRGLGFLKDN